MPARRAPRTAKDMAIRWSLWHAISAGVGTNVAGSTPFTHIPSSSSPASMPSLPSSVHITCSMENEASGSSHEGMAARTHARGAQA
eukprot:scaffold59922_cov31-Tisochrysis_lutea.AAC.2